jgi:YVTN family beta-propeller protein
MPLKQFLIRALTRGRRELKKGRIIAKRNLLQTILAILVVVLPVIYFLTLHFTGSIEEWTNGWGRTVQAITILIATGPTLTIGRFVVLPVLSLVGPPIWEGIKNKVKQDRCCTNDNDDKIDISYAYSEHEVYVVDVSQEEPVIKKIIPIGDHLSIVSLHVFSDQQLIYVIASGKGSVHNTCCCLACCRFISKFICNTTTVSEGCVLVIDMEINEIIGEMPLAKKPVRADMTPNGDEICLIDEEEVLSTSIVPVSNAAPSTSVVPVPNAASNPAPNTSAVPVPNACVTDLYAGTATFIDLTNHRIMVSPTGIARHDVGKGSTQMKVIPIPNSAAILIANLQIKRITIFIAMSGMRISDGGNVDLSFVAGAELKGISVTYDGDIHVTSNDNQGRSLVTSFHWEGGGLRKVTSVESGSEELVTNAKGLWKCAISNSSKKITVIGNLNKNQVNPNNNNNNEEKKKEQKDKKNEKNEKREKSEKEKKDEEEEVEEVEVEEVEGTEKGKKKKAESAPLLGKGVELKDYGRKWEKRLPVSIENNQPEYTVPLPSSLSSGTFSSGAVMSFNENVACIPIKLRDQDWIISTLYRNSGDLKWAVHENPIPEIKGIAMGSMKKPKTGCKLMIVPIVLAVFLVLEIVLLSVGLVLLKEYGHIDKAKLCVRDNTHSSYPKFDLAQLEGLPFDQNGWYNFNINDHLDLVNLIPVANGPVASSLVPNQPQIYVVSELSKEVSVIDVHQSKIIGTISLTAVPSNVAISPDGKYAWVLSPFNNITVIEVSTRNIVARLSLGSNVELKKMIIRPDGELAWVVGGNETTAIDTAIYKVKNVPIGVGRQSEDIALTFDDKWALVPSREDNVIAVINARELIPTKLDITEGVGNEPCFIVSSSYKWAFVANYASGTVSVIDTDELKICANISVPSEPYHLLLSPDGKRVYGLAKRGQATFAIEIATQSQDCSANRLIGLASLPTTPYAMAITLDGSRIVVTHEWTPSRGGGITIVDATRIEDLKTVVKTIWLKGSNLGEPILVNQ